MSSFRDILTPSSLSLYTSWQAVVQPETYEFISPGTYENSICVQCIHQNGTVMGSITLNTTTDMDSWLSEYVDRTTAEEYYGDEYDDIINSQMETTAI